MDAPALRGRLRRGVALGPGQRRRQEQPDGAAVRRRNAPGGRHRVGAEAHAAARLWLRRGVLREPRRGDSLYALPAVHEKGHVDIYVELRVAGGHSSQPLPHTGIGPVIAKYGLQLDAFPGEHEYEALVGDEEPVVRPEGWEASVYNGPLALEARDKSWGTPISPTSGAVWDTFSGTIRHRYAFEGGTAVPVGEIMTENTDARHYLCTVRSLVGGLGTL